MTLASLNWSPDFPALSAFLASARPLRNMSVSAPCYFPCYSSYFSFFEMSASSSELRKGCILRRAGAISRTPLRSQVT
ncbi:Adenylate cyclase [Fusarium oxysporum f. sp. albedinis]|nr:Adenylate cyclase [Fusarium oxysporum f. sp. albedinis]